MRRVSPAAVVEKLVDESSSARMKASRRQGRVLKDAGKERPHSADTRQQRSLKSGASPTRVPPFDRLMAVCKHLVLTPSAATCANQRGCCCFLLIFVEA